MTHEIQTSPRELDSRTNDGIHVRLLWREDDGRLWVDLIDTKTGEAFSVDVHNGEPPLEVFHHPYAYAAHHGSRRQARREPAEAVATVAS
jgi:hypothetical protein